MFDFSPKTTSSATEPMIYGYRRVSTNKQLKGTGKKQQEESIELERLSEKFGLPVSTRTFEDDGRSAFHGDHLKGSLGAFLKAVDDGEIASGSILAVFSIDRISRLEITAGQMLFLTLIGKGIRVYTGIDEKLYGGDPKDHFTDLLLSMVQMERAYNESLHKQDRTVKNALLKIQEHMEGVRSPDGYAYAIKSVGGLHPWWCQVDPDTNEVKKHPIYFDIARDICLKKLAGWGATRIQDYLNSTDVPPPTRNHKAKSKGWGYNIIARLHHTANIMGTRTLTVMGTEYSLKDYFPQVVSEGEYHRLITMNAGRAEPKSSKRISLLTGNGLTKCLLCGSSVGSSHGRHVHTYHCLGKQKRITNDKGEVCKGWYVTGAELDVEIMLRCKAALLRKAQELPSDNGIAAVEGKLAAVNKEIENLVEAMKLAPSVKEIALQLNLAGQQRTELLDELEKLKSESRYAHIDTEVEWSRLTDGVLDSTNTEARLKMRALIGQLVESVEIKPLNPGARGANRRFIAFVRFRNSEHVAHIQFRPYYHKSSDDREVLVARCKQEGAG